MAAFATEPVAGNVFISAFRTRQRKLCPALATELPSLRIFRLALWALHGEPPSPQVTLYDRRAGMSSISDVSHSNIRGHKT